MCVSERGRERERSGKKGTFAVCVSVKVIYKYVQDNLENESKKMEPVYKKELSKTMKIKYIVFTVNELNDVKKQEEIEKKHYWKLL